MNLQKAGEPLLEGQKLHDDNLIRCWEECTATSHFHSRTESVNNFNCDNKLKKRGICLVPVRLNVAPILKQQAQATAVIQVYTGDGSVSLSHGGVEMGQGLYTKMIQIAGRVLGLPCDMIHTSSTTTDINPNHVSTSASNTTDLVGAAVQNACEMLNLAIKPYKEAAPNGTWLEWVNAAHQDQVNLTFAGHHRMDFDFDYETMKGNFTHYFTYGVACSEVEIDCLTGQHEVLRTDIVMDIGKSLNPSIDIGQIEGAFVQGYGLYMLEEVTYDNEGHITSAGADCYRIPSVADIPKEFNVYFLKDSENPKAVYSSKGLGEPPLMSGLSVFLATKEAISAARADLGKTGYFRLDSPATAERVKMAIDH